MTFKTFLCFQKPYGNSWVKDISFTVSNQFWFVILNSSKVLNPEFDTNLIYQKILYEKHFNINYAFYCNRLCFFPGGKKYRYSFGRRIEIIQNDLMNTGIIWRALLLPFLFRLFLPLFLQKQFLLPLKYHPQKVKSHNHQLFQVVQQVLSLQLQGSNP